MEEQLELFGSHMVTLVMVRTLALECYSLDKAAYHLFLDGTHDDVTGGTRKAYHELYTQKILQLAITLRLLFYQDIDPNSTTCYITHSGFLDRWKRGSGAMESLDFNAKDVSDKIIHAREISRDLEEGVQDPTTLLRGTTQSGDRWEQSISITLFAEGILNGIQDLSKAET